MFMFRVYIVNVVRGFLANPISYLDDRVKGETRDHFIRFHFDDL